MLGELSDVEGTADDRAAPVHQQLSLCHLNSAPGEEEAAHSGSLSGASYTVLPR